jgi:hypothetical protein
LTTGGFSFGGPIAAPAVTAAASFSTGFSFGSAVSTPAPVGGFSFGAATTPVVAKTEIVSIAAAPATSSVASVLLSATRYAQELGLDEDEAEDVQSEIDNAREAWSAVVTGGSDTTTVAASECGEDGIFDRLMTRLGTTFSAEEHGEQLTAVLDSDRQLSVFAFADWYIRWLYKSDGSDAGDDEEAEQQSSATSGSSQGWSNVKWSVAPVGESSTEGGWKCASCSVMNGATQGACVCCATPNPNAVVVSPAAASVPSSTTGGFTFGGPVTVASPSPAAASAPSTTGGFSFGGPIAAPAVTAAASFSTGFSFGSAVSTPAPVGGFSFGAATTPVVAKTEIGSAPNGFLVSIPNSLELDSVDSLSPLSSDHTPGGTLRVVTTTTTTTTIVKHHHHHHHRHHSKGDISNSEEQTHSIVNDDEEEDEETSTSTSSKTVTEDSSCDVVKK